MNADEYVRNVESALRDLPWSQRRDLVAELRSHLADFPPDTDLEARLGTPERYAADLRDAEGVDRRRGPIAFVKARRPRNVILTVAAVVTIALVATGIAWVQSYQPLSWAGGGFLSPRGSRANDGVYVTLTFHKRGHFALGLPITNTGSLPVQVLGLGGLHPDPLALIPNPPMPFSVRLRMSRAYIYEPKHLSYSRFHPFDLQPGRSVTLVLDATYKRDCRPWGPGLEEMIAPTGFQLREGFIPIRFHFLWKTSTALINPYDILQIRFPKGCL